MGPLQNQLKNLPGRALGLLGWAPVPLLAILYFKTACPYVLPGDPAELVTAATTLGLAHPTGYPLYVLLGKLSTLLAFFAAPERAVNYLSAVCTVLTVAILTFSLLKLKLSPLSVAVAVLLFGTTGSVWHYATMAEVYALHALLFSLTVLLMISFEGRAALYKLLLIVFVAGLSVGNHMTSVLIYPGLLIWLIGVLRNRPEFAKATNLLCLLCSFLAGISIIFVIFLLDRPDALNYLARFRLDQPDLDLDSAFRRFAWMITGAQYHAASGFISALFSSAMPQNMLRQLAAVITDNGFLVLCGVAGFYLPRPDRSSDESFDRLRRFFAVTLLATILYLVTYDRFFQPILFICGYAIFVFGTARLLDYLTSFKVQRAILLILLLAVCLAMTANNYRRIDKSQKDIFQTESRVFLRAVEPNAVVVSTWGNATLFWFHQWVHKVNPKVAVVSADPENWRRIASAYRDRPLYFEALPPGMSARAFGRVRGFYKLTTPAGRRIAPRQR